MTEEINKIHMFIRKSISEEQLAIADYLKRRNKLSDMEPESQEEAVKINTFIATLDDIIAEEEIHVGQLTQLLEIFSIDRSNEQKGYDEALDTFYEWSQD